MQPVITLCGSTKFKEEFLEAAKRIGESGALVISVTTFTHADELSTSDELMAILDAIHMQKIMMSNAIFVINKDGYVGESTLREIAFAAVLKKRMSFLEEPSSSIHNMIDKLGGSYVIADTSAWRI